MDNVNVQYGKYIKHEYYKNKTIIYQINIQLKIC